MIKHYIDIECYRLMLRTVSFALIKNEQTFRLGSGSKILMSCFVPKINIILLDGEKIKPCYVQLKPNFQRIS